MTCNREYEMSQCLDGRLATSQRSALLDHVVRCRPCGDLWEQMNRAQGLARSLRAWPVSKDFRAQLWQRIQAGEAIPQAVTADTVPFRTKVRYFGTGAAAAGLLILAGGYWFDQDRGEEVQPSAAAPHQPAAENAPSLPPWAAGFAPMLPASALGAVSSLAIGGLRDNVRLLQRRLAAGTATSSPRVAASGGGPNAGDAAPGPRAIAQSLFQIADEMERARAFASCLLRLHDQGLVEMNAPDLALVEQVRQVLDGCMRSSTGNDMGHLTTKLQPLQHVDLSRIACVVKVRPGEDCRWQLHDLMQRDPKIGEALGVEFEIVNNGGLQIGPDRLFLRTR